MQSSPPSGVAPLRAPSTRPSTGPCGSLPGAGVFPLLVAGATDGRYWRGRGYAAYGFGPVIMTARRPRPCPRDR